MVLWCDGLKIQGTSSKSSEESDSEVEEVSKSTKQKKKKRKVDSDTEDRVRATIKELKECHANAGYTVMQFRIWAEMFVGGVHPSLDEAPKSTTFLRAGGGAAPKK